MDKNKYQHNFKKKILFYKMMISNKHNMIKNI